MGPTILIMFSFMMMIFGVLVDFSSSTPNSRARSFLFAPKKFAKPQLILISGCTGTGKSTFGMTVALSQGILKCISTDSVREVMRTYDRSPALHRSSYEGDGDPVDNWKECCYVLENSIDALVTDAIKRGVSIVLEGVHIIPSNVLIERWRASGGVALGCLLAITDAEDHRSLIFRRGEITRKGEDKKMSMFARIRTIQDEMVRLAAEGGWLVIEQKLEPDPIDIVTSLLDDDHNYSIDTIDRIQ